MSEQDTGEQDTKHRSSRYRPGPAVWVVLAVVALVTLGLAAGTSNDEGGNEKDGGLVVAVDGQAKLGEPAPDVAVPTFDGEQLRLSDLEGRPVVLNFWASWCAPCVAEMPAFEQVHQELGDQVTFVGINQRDQPEQAARLVRDVGVTYTLARDQEGRSFDAFGAFGMPTTVFIQADGTVVEIVTGQLDEQLLTENIETYLGVTAT